MNRIEALRAEIERLTRELRELKACFHNDPFDTATPLRAERDRLRAECGNWQLECARLQAIIASYEREYKALRGGGNDAL